MGGLQGRTIIILEARMPSEMAGLVERHGGIAINAPALREVPVPLGENAAAFIDTLCSGTVEAVVFLTGVGARALLNAADSLGKGAELLRALADTKVICRGPKPVAVMRTNKVPIALTVPEPHTSETLVDSIRAQRWNLDGKYVALQHYGEVNTYLRTELAGMGAKLMEISLYEWALPEDTEPLERAIHAIVKGHTDAVAFTTQSQVRHLLLMADRLGMKDALKVALNTRVAVAPVGPVCVRALSDEGIASHVIPEHPKMGHLVVALANHFTNVDASIDSDPPPTPPKPSSAGQGC